MGRRRRVVPDEDVAWTPPSYLDGLTEEGSVEELESRAPRASAVGNGRWRRYGNPYWPPLPKPRTGRPRDTERFTFPFGRVIFSHFDEYGIVCRVHRYGNPPSGMVIFHKLTLRNGAAKPDGWSMPISQVELLTEQQASELGYDTDSETYTDFISGRVL